MSDNKRYNIAITGTFDVENYGDLLFPVIFEKAMKKRGLKFRLFLFSPSETANKALDDSAVVYSYSEFEKMHKKYHFDALVVGGGAIIHFNNIRIKLPGTKVFSDYRNTDSWYTLMYLAAKNNIKILFNVPQVPFVFTESVAPLAKSVFMATEYLSVRDDFSKEYMEALFASDEVVKIRVFPDSVCSISQYYDKDSLRKSAKRLLGFDDKYMVVHFSRVMPEEAEPCLVELIHKIEKKKYKVVFLPLGYTHGDDVAMVKFKEKYDLNDCFVFNKKLSIDDMTAVLAGCECYIGTSFHGSIVSVGFGNKAISFNYYEPTLKNVDNYRRFGISKYLASNYKMLNPIFDELDKNKKAYRPKLKEIIKLVEEHFDAIFQYIVEERNEKCNNYDCVREALLGLISVASQRDAEMDAMQNSLDGLRNENGSLVNRLDEKTKDCDRLIRELDECRKSYDLVINSKSWKITKPIRKLKRMGGIK